MKSNVEKEIGKGKLKSEKENFKEKSERKDTGLGRQERQVRLERR